MGEQNDFACFVDQLNDSWGDTFDTGPIGDLAAYDRYVEVHAYQHAFVLDISVVKRRKRSHAASPEDLLLVQVANRIAVILFGFNTTSNYRMSWPKCAIQPSLL